MPAWSEVKDPAWEQSRMEAYAAAVDHVDQGVGQIVETLRRVRRRLGQYEQYAVSPL